MKVQLFSILVATALTCSAQINSPAQDGWLERARTMSRNHNWEGVLDQLNNRHFLESSEQESADFLFAEAMAHINEESAIPLLEKFLYEWPSSVYIPRVRLLLAQCYLDDGDNTNAYNEIIKIKDGQLGNIEKSQYHLAKGRLLLNQGEYEEASNVLFKVTEEPYSSEALFYQGYAQYGLGRYEESIQIFNLVNLNSEAYQPSLMGKTRDYFMLGEWQKATEEAQKYLSFSTVANDDYIEATRIAGESLFNLNQIDQSAAYIEKYVRLTGDKADPSALYIMGVHDYNNRKYNDAIDHLQKASTLNNGLGQSASLYLGQSYLETGNETAALLALRKASQMDFDISVKETASYNYAVASIQKGNVPFGSTTETLEKFLNEYPNSPYATEIEEYLVRGYMTDQNYQKALASINRIKNPSVALLSAKQQVFYNLGIRELSTGNNSQALDYFNKAKELKTSNTKLNHELTLWTGETYLRNKEYEKAAESFLSYLKGAANDTENKGVALYNLGYTRFEQKRYTDAITNFERFLKSSSNISLSLQADALSRIADAYYYQKKFEQAANYYDKAYAANPTTGDYALYQKAMMKGLTREHRAKISGMEKMMKEFPQSGLIAQAMLEMAESYGDLGDKASARDIYSEVAKTYYSTSQGRQAQLLLAISEYDNRNIDDAINNYKKVISQWPTSDEAVVAAEDLKQIYTDRGEASEYIRFMSGINGIPAADKNELETLSYQAALKALGNNRDQSLMKKYLADWPDGKYVENACLALADENLRSGNNEEAYTYYIDVETKSSNAATLNKGRKGVLETAILLERWEVAETEANKLLGTSILNENERRTVLFNRGKARFNQGKNQAALNDWDELTDNLSDEIGAKALYHVAMIQFNEGNLTEAMDYAQKLVDANTPYPYWTARAFILISDIHRAQGNTFEANEYLKSLKENYPLLGQDDIESMINSRLK